MVNCWFGALWFGFVESPYERDWDSWGPCPDSNPKPLNAPNQQSTITLGPQNPWKNEGFEPPIYGAP